MFYSCPFVSLRGSIIPPFVSFVCFVVHPYPMDAWQNCRAGAPTRTIHALPSSPSSLFPTYQKPTAKCPRTTFFSLLSSPYLASIHPVRILGKSGHSKSLEYKELDIALIAQRL